MEKKRTLTKADAEARCLRVKAEKAEKAEKALKAEKADPKKEIRKEK